MSDPVSALGGAHFAGAATVREIGPLGMITLRGKGLKGLDKAVKAAVGTKVPAQRRIEVAGANACAWMSPDEYLLILPYDKVAKAMEDIGKGLAEQHHLCVDVSDARAVFRIEGPEAVEVLRKLVPVDLDRLDAGEMRRSRAAQVACALWRDDAGFTLVAFRSVARYVFDLLANAAR
ncbi:sarcosine oxidase subunit gamma [Tabrizicola piscis]|uniref:Sarcosine oxidase subunit gamma n=1 Tax=Tabrizicola piscis TaxID=2494374 RepID=A0A3S8UAA8_9RHOB|nr:sarcosine oxidase subunit gamma family protein [Tabrizicola piscis]AZL60544.1 sarcosine oxidase subunit gamma [Tabrizicola piscis]